MELVNKFDLRYPQLKKDYAKKIDQGENPYKVVLSAAAKVFLSIVRDPRYIDTQDSFSDFFGFLADVRWDFSVLLDHEGEEADFLDLLLLYYLFLEHAGMTGDFKEIVRWVPGLTREQRRRILSWPEEYVFSLFEVKSRGEKLTYKDVRTNIVYQINAAVSGIDFAADNRKKTTVLALIVPMEKDYLSTPPFIYPLNVFAIGQIKKIEDYLFDPEELISDYYYCSKHKGIPVGHTLFHPNSHTNLRVTLRNEGPRESDPRIAKLLIDQHDFFREFEHREQAEKLLTKIVEQFPRMFYPYPDISELMEAFRLLFSGSNELISSQDEEVTYWYEAICEKFNEEVKAIEPYIMEGTADDTSV